MIVEINIKPELDSNYSEPKDIVFTLSNNYIILELENREITFFKSDIEKLIKISNI